MSVTEAAELVAYQAFLSTDGTIRVKMRAALEAATTQAAPDTDRIAEDRAQWLATLKAQQTAAEFSGEVAATQSDVLDKIAACLDRLSTDPSAEDVRVDAAYLRGQKMGMEVAGAHYAHPATGPTDYEMWRDAWQLAVNGSLRDSHPSTLRLNAEWFHEQLRRGAPKPFEPDCSHCGADSSMDHDEGCPNAPIEWYVACGCSGHGDHLACTDGCADTGCQHRVGEEITASTEGEADRHTHGPTCQRGASCPPCHMIGGQHSAWCPQAERERSADQVDPTEDGDR